MTMFLNQNALADTFDSKCRSSFGEYTGSACYCQKTKRYINPYVEPCIEHIEDQTPSKPRSIPPKVRQPQETSFWDYFSIDKLESVTSATNTYDKFLCKNKKPKNEISDTWHDVCAALYKSDLCRGVKPGERLNCNNPNNDKIDLRSFDFILNCGWGLWESFTGFVEFIWDVWCKFFSS